MTEQEFIELEVDDEDLYEKQSKENRKLNNSYLDAFQAALEEKGLSPKTIDRHLSNVHLYLNHFLWDYSEETMVEGCSASVDTFFDYFFIRKCMWSTPANVKTTATSIRKFYQLMSELAFISKEDYQWLAEFIKDNVEIWQEACRIYNDPEEPYVPYFW